MAENLVYAGMVALVAATLLGLRLFFVRLRQHESRSGRWWKLPLGNVLVLACIVALAVLAGESYFRFWYDATDSFAFSKTSRRWFDRHYRLNRMGYRDDREYAPARPAGKRRVAFVGDSFTVGQGVPRPADRFADRIRALRPDWEIQLLAANGDDSGAQLERLVDLAATAYEFDLVVLAYCLNDIGDATAPLVDRLHRACRTYHGRRPGFLVEHSYLFNTLHYRIGMRRVPEIADYFLFQHDDYFSAAWESHTLRLRAMRDVVRDRGGRFCVVTFPYMHRMGPGYEFRDVHRRLDEFWAALGVPHLDLLPVYEPHPPRRLTVNSHDAHPNEFAHGLAADALLPFLDRQIGLHDRAGGPQAPRPLSAETVDELIRCFRDALAFARDPAAAHARLAGLLLERGQVDEAIGHSTRALAIAPDRVSANADLGVALAARGRLDEAVATYRRALDAGPDDARIRSNLGNALARLGRPDEAIAEYRRALAISPDSAEARFNLGNVLAAHPRHGSTAAIAEYRRAIEIRPDYAEAHNNLAVALAGRGEIDEAVAHLRRALEIDPGYADARRNLDTIEARRR